MKKVVPENAILIPPEAKRVFEGVIFDVYQWQQQLYDGSMATFERIKRADTVLVVCSIDDKILVIEDEQPGRGKKLKLPGGRVDPDDDSHLAAAKREIREETGYEFANLKLVNVMQPENKIEWFVSIFVATDVTHQELAKADAGEHITPHLKSFDEVKYAVRSGKGMMGYSRDLFEGVESLDDLRNLPEYRGKEVDR
jgi:8-oxo-dGTP pyrophosphatase MutT (NUDIX family)